MINDILHELHINWLRWRYLRWSDKYSQADAMKRDIWNKFTRAVNSRSPRQVAKMERDRNLTR